MTTKLLLRMQYGRLVETVHQKISYRGTRIMKLQGMILVRIIMMILVLSENEPTMNLTIVMIRMILRNKMQTLYKRHERNHHNSQVFRILQSF